MVLNCSRSGLVPGRQDIQGNFPRCYMYAVLKILYLGRKLAPRMRDNLKKSSGRRGRWLLPKSGETWTPRSHHIDPSRIKHQILKETGEPVEDATGALVKSKKILKGT